MKVNGIAPETVAIVGLGPTSASYVEQCMIKGSRRKVADQTWIINALTGLLDGDLIFHMDDFRVQERRAEKNDAIAAMLENLRNVKIPIITSREYPEYPMARAFPLEACINECGSCYFNSTVSYAIAYARMMRVRRLQCWGIDFHYPHAPQIAERGRGCAEFWLAKCMEVGIHVAVPPHSTLLDGGGHQFYGYDSQNVNIQMDGDDRVSVTFSDKPLPTGEEQEKKYDPLHPSALHPTMKRIEPGKVELEYPTVAEARSVREAEGAV